MTIAPFDTLKFTKDLEAGGFSPLQCNAAAGAFAEATHDFATKGDIGELRQELKYEIGALRQELTHKMDVAVRDVKIWGGGILMVAISILFAALHYIPPAH